MIKKKILIIPSITHHPSHINSVISPLAFLEDEYTLHTLDSLLIMKNLPNAEYYALWQQELMKHLPHYDAFFGFSFGGVILQQCFSSLTTLNKPIVLFSTPTFADDALSEKLGAVVALCQKNQVDEALHSLYQHVFYPNEMPSPLYEPCVNNEEAAQRLIFGLTRVLMTDATCALKANQTAHLHLIGERSDLVNQQNVRAPQNGTLITVPDAGMRMLLDNLPFCKRAILEVLTYGA